jgi:hypothetical protein
MALPILDLPTYELEVPSTGKTIRYRPFLVKEEKVLLLALEGEDDKAIEVAVKNLLKGCITSRIKLENLSTFDLEYIFLKIRAASVGEVVEMEVTCLDDNETKIKYNLDLNKVEVVFPEGHSNKIMLTEETGIVMRYPGFDRFVQNSVSGVDLSTDDIFDIIAESIDQIFQGDEVYDSSTTTKKEFREFVDSLTTQQFEKIQAFFETAPKLSHSFSVRNPNTGLESTYTIEGLSNFFG